MIAICSMCLLVVGAAESSTATAPERLPQPAAPSGAELVDRQIEHLLKAKLVKKFPPKIDESFPIRLRDRRDMSPEEHRAWVRSSPNRVTLVAKFPENLEEALDLRLLGRRAVAERRYQFDLRVVVPLREINIRLEVPPGGFLFDSIDTDIQIDLRVDFEWDYIGEKDQRKTLFSFLEERDIGLFPGGTAEYLKAPEKRDPPKLLNNLDLHAKLELARLRISGIRGKRMYENGRFVARLPLWQIVAGAANLGLGIAEEATQSDNLIERIVEGALNQALYDAEPRIIALANRELVVEEPDAQGHKIRPFDVLRDTLPKQAIPAILPGKKD